MSPLILGFLAILVISFGLIIFLTTPSKDEKLLDMRLASIRHSDANGAATREASERLVRTDLAQESPWAERLFGNYKVVQKLRLLILQSASKTTVDRVFLMVTGLAFGGFTLGYLFLDNLAIALPAGILAGAIPILFLNYKRAKRLKAFDAELSNGIDMMSNALRAGHSVVGAIGILAEQALEPVASEFREVFRQQNFGLPLRDALLDMLNRVPSADLRVVITAILVQKDTGGNLGEILDRTVFVIRERVRIKGEIRVQTAQGRMTGWVLSALPVILLFLINLINPGYSSILLDDPFGRKLAYSGVVLLVVGAWTIRHMVNKIEV